MGEVQAVSGGSGRVCRWDNVKAVLILMVVIGHLVSENKWESDACRSVYIFIYAFHMPLFIFISGFFHKNRNIKNKILFYFVLGVILRILIYAVKNLWWGEPGGMYLFTDGVQWYMFAMVGYIALSYLMRVYDRRLVLGIALLFACFSGYVQEIDDFLTLSRIIVYFPVYWAGYCLQGSSRFQALIAPAERRRRVITVCIGVSLLVAWALFSGLALEQAFAFRPFFKGNGPYPGGFGTTFWGVYNRLLCYGISALLSLALIAVMPDRRIPVLTQVGEYSLAVFFWHRPFVYILEYCGVLESVYSLREIPAVLVCILIAAGLTILFSRRLFMRPLDRLRRMILHPQPAE